MPLARWSSVHCLVKLNSIKSKQKSGIEEKASECAARLSEGHTIVAGPRRRLSEEKSQTGAARCKCIAASSSFCTIPIARRDWPLIMADVMHPYIVNNIQGIALRWPQGYVSGVTSRCRKKKKEKKKKLGKMREPEEAPPLRSMDKSW